MAISGLCSLDQVVRSGNYLATVWLLALSLSHLVGSQLCRLSTVGTHTVALKPVMGK